jgi:hypothetical protein
VGEGGSPPGFAPLSPPPLLRLPPLRCFLPCSLRTDPHKQTPHSALAWNNCQSLFNLSLDSIYTFIIHVIKHL